MPNPDQQLMLLVKAIVAGDSEKCAMLLAESPRLATTIFEQGATRSSAKPYFIPELGRYIYAGDTALHIAAAAYEPTIVTQLISAGAKVLATNRFGYNPLHSAAAGSPNSPRWNPSRQAMTIVALVKAGIDPNMTDKRGVTPLHIAVRTRCALAVKTLVECGADPTKRNKNGSDALVLATNNTGRGGSGSPDSKREQQLILEILR
jgi:hypothetical protein